MVKQQSHANNRHTPAHEWKEARNSKPSTAERGKAQHDNSNNKQAAAREPVSSQLSAASKLETATDEKTERQRTEPASAMRCSAIPCGAMLANTLK